MRVLVAPDDTGCGRYRLREPARVLAAAGHDVGIMDEEWSARVLVPDDSSSPVLLDDPPDADVVVFQRVMRGWRVDAIRALQQAGVTVVVDVDDDMHSIDKGNAAYKACHPHYHLVDTPEGKAWLWDASQPAEQGWHHLRVACEIADLVTCTTPALAARYGRHGRAQVLPNLVPAAYLDIDRRNGTAAVYSATPESDAAPVVGWGGTVRSHPNDLQVTRGAVAQVLRETGAPFHVVGVGTGVAERLHLDETAAAAMTTTGDVPLDQWADELARLDIGIVPLADTPFNQAKSALKLMEMASVGVAVVASATPDNLRMNRHGVGLLARTRADWTRQLRRLVADPILRDDLAATGRAVMRRHTYEQHAHTWWDAWQAAHERRRVEVAA